MKRNSGMSFNIAFCGIICALSVIVMFASLIPSLTYALPAISGIVLWTICGQINRKWALLSYIAVSALSFMIVPEMEANIFFIFFFGYYPIIRDLIEKVKPKLLAYLIKLGVFNVAVVLAYFLLCNLLGFDKMVEGLEDFGEYAVMVLWGAGNVAFLCYDIALTYVMFAYDKWLKPKFAKRIK